MWEYILFVSICAVIWIINGRWIIQAIKEHFTAEIYAHLSLGIFFTLLTLELTIRQPITLGLAIWSIALILVFQSIPALILGLSSAFCSWVSARTEAEYNIRKFGDEYKEYMKKVPMWNLLKGIRRIFSTRAGR